MIQTTPFRVLEAEALADMTSEERAEFDTAHDVEETRLRVAEMVYAARTQANLSQSELSVRAGMRQSVISAIETGAQLPTILTLRKIAVALNRSLTIDFEPVTN